MRKKLLCLIFAMIMLVSIPAYSESGIQALPEVVSLNKVTPYYDTKAGIDMGISGLFEKDITVNNVIRSIKLYIPESAELGAYFIVLNVPDGKETVQWLKNSGWLALADEEGFCLYIMEAHGGNGEWDTVEEELPYVTAAFNDVSAGRGNYYLPFPTYYVVGYGTGGTALQRVVMKNGIMVAGATFIDASDIDGTYLSEMATTKYANSDIAYSEVPVPVWIISKSISGNTLNVINYWKKANVVNDSSKSFNGGKIHYQEPETLYDFTPTSCSSVAILEKKNISYDDANFWSRWSNFCTRSNPSRRIGYYSRYFAQGFIEL